MKEKINLGVVVGTRGFFNPELANSQRGTIRKEIEGLGMGCFILPKDATPTGAIESQSDARKCARFFDEHRNEIDGIVITLPNFGDEIAAVTAVHLAALGVPVLLHALADSPDKLDLSGRRDAYCGKLSVANNLRQYGIPFTPTERHVYFEGEEAFIDELRSFGSMCRIVRGMKNARIGAIGARPAAFQTVRSSEKILQATGISVVPVDLSEILARARAMDDSAAVVVAAVETTRALGTVPEGVPNELLVRNGRFQAAVAEWLDENELDAYTIQCWTSIQLNYGCAACTVMSITGEDLRPGACEVDINGAVSMYALSLASLAPSAITDWNNNVGDDSDLVSCVHCGNYPKSFFGTRPEVSYLDVLGANLGTERCFGAVKGRVLPGDMTYLRISTDDVGGRMIAYTGEGAMIDEPFPIAGAVVVARIPRLESLMKYVMANGFEHHVTMVRGSWASPLREALGAYLGIETYHHK